MVFAGSFWPSGTERGLADGFRSLGWAVQEIDSRDHGMNSGGHFGMRLASRAFRSIAVRTYQNEVLKACQDLKPDVFLTVKGVNITLDLLRRIRECGTRTVMYYPDRDFDHRGVREKAFPAYNLFVTTKTYQQKHLVAGLGEVNVAHVPHGYVDWAHRPVFESLSEEDYRTDVLYPGNHSPSKQEWLEAAFADLSQTSIEIVGERWDSRASTGPLSRSRMLGTLTGISYAKAIQRARINVAIHYGPNAIGWEDAVSTRTFEIPACKGFMLHIDSEEVRQLFKPGEEIDVFTTPEELADKIQYYIARPALRAQMIQRAYARAVPAYGYRARASALQGLLSRWVKPLERMD
jgi:spore maturation protein CgeB